MLLGKRGTFVFCALMYLLAFGVLFYYYREEEQLIFFWVLQIFFIPVLVYFLKWVTEVWKDATKADFAHTMKMNWLASGCTNLGFITLLILHQIG
jgi:1,4-dihydroxy-2-naphthoate octaprenyltransferase